MSTSPPHRGRWAITQEAFDLLLDKLDGDRERAGERYEMVRRKLVKFFELRGGDAPEEHADETLNRVARKLAEGEEVENLNAYAVGVARLLLKEVFKRRVRERAALAQIRPGDASPHPAEDEEPLRPLSDCLTQCLEKLPAQSRSLIVDYYEHEREGRIERRKAVARALGIELNALRIRAHRIRTELEDCVRACVRGAERLSG